MNEMIAYLSLLMEVIFVISGCVEVCALNVKPYALSLSVFALTEGQGSRVFHRGERPVRHTSIPQTASAQQAPKVQIPQRAPPTAAPGAPRVSPRTPPDARLQDGEKTSS